MSTVAWEVHFKLIFWSNSIAILNPLANGRSPPEPTGARGKASLIEVDDGLLGLLSLLVALDEVFTPSVALRLKSLGVQQRFLRLIPNWISAWLTVLMLLTPSWAASSRIGNSTQ